MNNKSNKEMTSSNDLFIIPDGRDTVIKHYKQVVPVTVHHFYISDEITEVDRYLELINVLKIAEQHDTVFIYLNTPGGHLNTAIQLVSAIRQSSANVVTCLEGEVCSAGTIIFLAGNKYLVNPNCTFMIHSYSAWIGGKGNEIAAHARYREEYFRKLMRDIYGKFLTETEIDSVIDGKDLWMDSDEVISRLEKKVAADAKDSESDEIDLDVIANKLPDIIQQLVTDEATKKATSKKLNEKLDPSTIPVVPTPKKKSAPEKPNKPVKKPRKA